MPTRPYLSVVIPAYNEETRLGPTLDRVLAWGDGKDFDVELLVVDDGSSDDTVGLVRRSMTEHPNLQVLENGKNRGKGFSVGHGVSRATGEHVLFSDADLSTPIEAFDGLHAALQGADIAIGSRNMPDSELTKRQAFYREGMGRTFNLLVRMLVFPGIRDTQCGFKLFRSEVAKELFATRKLDGFAFDVEVLFVARRRGYTVAELPVVWINDEASRVHPIRDALGMFRDILKIRRLHRGLGPVDGS